MITVYFDTCALNRLSDTASGPRIRPEADAVDRLLKLVAAGRLRWVASTILRFELEQNPDALRRLDTLRLLDHASETLDLSSSAWKRARELSSFGYQRLDSLHMALAEHAGVDCLITTDDRFLRRSERKIGSPAVSLANPVDFLQRRFPWPVQNPSQK